MYCIASLRTWMITQYQITHHSWNSLKHTKKFSETRMFVLGMISKKVLAALVVHQNRAATVSVSQKTRCEGGLRMYYIVSLTTWMITLYWIMHHSVRKFSAKDSNSKNYMFQNNSTSQENSMCQKFCPEKTALKDFFWDFLMQGEWLEEKCKYLLLYVDFL